MKKSDITGEVCPITLIKVKLVPEDMDAGETLEVRLDDGVPAIKGAGLFSSKKGDILC